MEVILPRYLPYPLQFLARLGLIRLLNFTLKKYFPLISPKLEHCYIFCLSDYLSFFFYDLGFSSLLMDFFSDTF